MRYRILSLLSLLVVAALTFLTLDARAEDAGEAIHARLTSTSPNQYLFRGLKLKDKGVIGQASSELVVDLYSSDTFRFGIPVGFWLSLHPGDKAGSVGPGPGAWFESRIDGGAQMQIYDLTLDGRLVVYSSPNGSFEDIYELRGIASYDDQVLFAGDSKKAIFRGIFPQATLATEAKGARDGAKSGTYAELAIAPRFHVLEGVALAADFSFPIRVGASLSHYYEVQTTASGKLEDQTLGFASFGGALDIDARFVPMRLGLYNVRLSLDAVLPVAQNEAVANNTDTVELVFSAQTVLRF